MLDRLRPTLLGISAFFALICLLPCVFASAAEVEWEVLPRSRPFRLTFADPREIRMGLAFEGGSRIQAMVGNYFSLVGLHWNERDVWHFGIEGAGFFGMHQSEGRFPLETTDGLIGVYVEGNRRNYQWQLRYTHLSSHLADGSSDTAIPFSREYLRLRVGWVPNPWSNFYAGATWIVNSVPRVPELGAQWGANFFFPIHWQMLVPFAATDFQWKQESAFNPTLSVQLGMAINNPPEAFRSFRLYYSYQSGADFRGQFYDRRLTLHSLGIEMQI